MNIIFIRHGDPDYEHDCLTEKGRREAALLAERVAKWKNIADFYVSPLGRARETAEYSLKKIGRSAEILPWLEEFRARVKDPDTGSERISWDLMPSYWTKEEAYFDRNIWTQTELYKTGDVAQQAEFVCNGIDSLLAKYGYIRNGDYYTVTDDAVRDANIVCFCHFAVTTVIMSRMLNISGAALVHGFFMPTTSVTVIGSEERQKGEAYFRVQTLGNTSHLYGTDEPVSRAGYFGDIFAE